MSTPQRESTEALRVWHHGPPPHIGWWNASVVRDERVWRWWDGKRWSMLTAACWDDAPTAAQCAEFSYRQPHYVTRRIKWTDYWPQGARVPRINPETGERT